MTSLTLLRQILVDLSGLIEKRNIWNKISFSINLHDAGKLKRREKDRHFSLTEQVFFIN